MGMKGKFENFKSLMNKQAASIEAFVQFCNNTLGSNILHRLHIAKIW